MSCIKSTSSNKSGLESMASLALVPRRENVLLPSQESGSLPLTTYLKLHRIFAEDTDHGYVSELIKFLTEKSTLILCAWNGFNGAPLTVPLSVIAMNAREHRFPNKYVRNGSDGCWPSYDSYCEARYSSVLLHPKAPLIKDASGTLVAMEAVNVVIWTPKRTTIPRTPVDRSRVRDRELSYVKHLPNCQRATALKKRGILTDKELETLFGPTDV